MHGPRNYDDRTWKLSANYSARTFPCYRAKPKIPQQLLCGSLESLTGNGKLQGDVLHGILPKNTVPTRVTHYAFIALQNFHSDHCLKHFCELIIIIINNYSPKWRWLAVDIYRAAKRRGKYPTLATDTEVNSCFSIY